LPAYNAALTLRQTWQEIPHDLVDETLLVDDHSSDDTVELARELGLTTFQHKMNLGYGRNQKTCYREALRGGADIVVMLHPDYQYSPLLINSVRYGLGVVSTALAYRVQNWGWMKFRMFNPSGSKLVDDYYEEVRTHAA
jgi:glycosyltransferase involved in cell wall biosynthesis